MGAKKLHKDWLTEGLIDFEYKKYILLAYFKEVDIAFNRTHLYPFLSDIIDHYNRLKSFNEGQQNMEVSFPKKIKKIDWENFLIEYENMLEDDNCIRELQCIVDYAMPKFENMLNSGKEIFDFIEDKMEIYPVGLLSNYTEEGFMMIRSGMQDTHVYEYRVSLFENLNTRYRTLKTKLVSTYQTSWSRSYERIKKELLVNYKSLSNPATYVIESALPFPIKESFLPVAKRRFMAYLVSEC